MSIDVSSIVELIRGNTWADQPRTADKATITMATVPGWARGERILRVNIAAGIRQLHHVNKADQIREESRRGRRGESGRTACHRWQRPGVANPDVHQTGSNSIILTTRKRKGRAIIPILPDLRALLDSIGPGTGAILRNSRGEPWTESGLGSVFQKAKPEGFDRTMHDLRGTSATWLAVRGLTDEEIARTIGWTAKRIGEIRSRYVDEARVIVSMVERLSAWHFTKFVKRPQTGGTEMGLSYCFYSSGGAFCSPLEVRHHAGTWGPTLRAAGVILARDDQLCHCNRVGYVVDGLRKRRGKPMVQKSRHNVRTSFWSRYNPPVGVKDNVQTELLEPLP